MQPVSPTPLRRSRPSGNHVAIASLAGSTALSVGVFALLVAIQPLSQRSVEGSAPTKGADDRPDAEGAVHDDRDAETQPGGTVSTGTASVFGIVTAGGDEPLPHEAVVSLAGADVGPARSASAGKDGRFAVLDLADGVYELRARAPGLVSRTTTGIVLEAGDRVEINLQLEPASTLEGRVEDSETGRPIAGARVLATEAELALTAATDESDATGSYRLQDVRAVSHHVSIEAEGYLPLAPVLQVPGGTPAIHRLVPAATLRGKVVDADGRPVPGVALEIVGNTPSGAPLALTLGSLSLRSLLPNAMGGSRVLATSNSLGVTRGPVPPIPIVPGSVRPQGTLPQNVLTGPDAVGFASDTDGGFDLTGVPPGNLRIVASAPGWALSQTPMFLVRPGVTLDGLELVLNRGGTVAGSVSDPHGVAVAHARVSVSCHEDPTPRATVTDEAGRFTVGGALGPCQVTVLPQVGLGATRSVVVQEGQSVDLALVTAADGESLECIVVDTTGHAIGGALLEVRATSADPTLSVVGHSDAEGRVAIMGLPPPPYLVSVSHADYAPLLDRRVSSRTGSRLILQAGARLVGRLMADWDRTPLSGAHVELREEDGSVVTSTRAGAEGRFEIQKVTIGNYYIYSSHVQVASGRHPLTISAADVDRGERDLGTLSLVQGGVLSGVVVDRLGAPAADARVSIGAVSGLTDALGQFRLAGVPPGRVAVRAVHATAGTAPPVTVRVHPAQETPGLRLALSGRTEAGERETDPSSRPAGVERTATGVAIEVATASDGVRVVRVAEGSRAAKAGLRVGDVLRSIDGDPVTIAGQARSLLRGPDGSVCVVELIRDGRKSRIRIQRERFSVL